MKKVMFIASALVFLGLTPHVFAQGFVPLTNIPGLTDVTANSTGGFANFFNNLYKYLIGIAAVLAVIEIIWGGLEISTQDSVSKHSDGKSRITQAILGLVLILLPVLVFTIINPSILNLSLNLPPLQTASSTGSGAGTQTSVTAPATGCTMVSSSPYLETAICANNSAANNYTCTNGLSLQIPACRVTDPSGNCVGPINAYCAGKSTTLTAYQYYGSTRVLSFGSNPLWIPSDQAAASAFMNGCQNSGGVYATANTAAATVFLDSYAYLVTSGCPSNAGITVDTTQYSGVACFSVKLSCNPPP